MSETWLAPYLQVDGQAAAHVASRVVAVSSGLRPELAWTSPLGFSGPVELVVCEARPDGPVEVFRSTGSASGHARVDTELTPWSRYSWDMHSNSPEEGDWHATRYFETPGRTLPAAWIEAAPGDSVRLRYISSPGARHRLVVAAQALVRPILDGRPVCPDTILPARTDLSRALYRVIDLDDEVEGERVLDLELGAGDWGAVRDARRVCAAVIVNGGVVASTSHASEAMTGSVILDIPFVREVIDHTASPQPSTAGLRVVTAAELGLAEVAPDLTPPITAHHSLAMTEIGRPGASRVYKSPTNIAGRSRITVRSALQSGTRLRVVHGEQLDDGGNVDTTNIALPDDQHNQRQTVEHIATGAVGEVLEAWFAYHGFQYLQVSGLPDDAEVTVEAVPLHTALAPQSELITNDPLVNAIVATTSRTLLNNVHGIPEDCPTREQSGWTGDSAAVAEFAFAAFDVQGFYAKWLNDMRTSQKPDGGIPGVAPEIKGYDAPVDPVWGAALPRLLDQHWLNYGDASLVATMLPVLHRWVDLLLSWRNEQGIVANAQFSYGHDWLALAPTPPELMHSVVTLEALEVASRLESEVGESPDRVRSLRDAETQLRNATRSRFVTNEAIANDSQGSLAYAVVGGLLTAEEEELALDAIVADMAERGWRVSTGFAATRALVLALGRRRPGALRAALAQPDEPGVGAMIAADTGTLWEAWWRDKSNNGTGSLDHVGLGGPFGAWGWSALAGVVPTASGWSEFEIAPTLVDSVTELSWRRRTPHGVASLHIDRTGARAVAEIVVPVGSSAHFVLGECDEILAPGLHRRDAHHAVVHGIPDTPRDAVPWTPPSLLGPRRDESRAMPLAWMGEELRHPDGIVCAPIAHAQLPGPTRAVAIRAGSGYREAIAESAQPVALHGGFLFAWVDTCALAMESVPLAELVAEWADGSSTSATTRAWHCGWVRATLPVLGDGGPLVRLILRVRAEEAVDRRPDAQPATIEIGPAGWSPNRADW